MVLVTRYLFCWYFMLHLGFCFKIFLAFSYLCGFDPFFIYLWGFENNSFTFVIASLSLFSG